MGTNDHELSFSDLVFLQATKILEKEGTKTMGELALLILATENLHLEDHEGWDPIITRRHNVNNALEELTRKGRLVNISNIASALLRLPE